MKKLFLFLLIVNYFSLFAKRYNTLISINDNQPNFALIQNKIKPLIDKIINEELKTEIKDVQFFIKPRHDITLYYLNDFKQGEEKLIEDILQKLKAEKRINNLTLLPEIDFFGDKNELVILINDSEKKLSELNKKLKEQLNKLNHDFEEKNKEMLYDQKSSEAFEYKPHITLGGRIGVDKIPGNKEDQQKLLNTIKQRIIKEIFPIICDLIRENNKLKAEAMAFYEMPKKTFLVKLAE